MDRAEYRAQVLAGLRRLSRREREAVLTELEEHIEDHAQALLDLGYDEKLAEERTMAAMGDPAEVGREMARQYPRGWRAVTGVSLALCVFVLFSVLSSSSNRKMIGYAWDSVAYRISPPAPETLISQFVAPRGIEHVSGVTEAVDIRRTVGGDVLRVYQITVGSQDSRTAEETWIYEGGYQDGALAAEAAEHPEEGQLTAEAAALLYSRTPGGLVSMESFNNLTAESQRGDQQLPFRRGAAGNPMIWQVFLRAPVQPGDDHITLRYEWLGETVTVDVPLPEGGAS